MYKNVEDTMRRADAISQLNAIDLPGKVGCVTCRSDVRGDSHHASTIDVRYMYRGSAITEGFRDGGTDALCDTCDKHDAAGKIRLQWHLVVTIKF
jgi:hypothetical protein